jgi:hypothetical protein
MVQERLKHLAEVSRRGIIPMFEATRIGAFILRLSDSITAQGSPVDKRVRRLFDEPFMSVAVRDMKQCRLSPDQATVAMIISLMNTFQNNAVLKKLFDDEYELFISFVRLYQGACHLMWNDPERFTRAASLFDQSVFKSLERAP